MMVAPFARASAVVLVAIFSSAPVLQSAGAQQGPIGELLIHYAEGDENTLLLRSLPLQDFERVVELLERDGLAWIRKDPADEPNRRLISATFALVAAERVIGTTKQVLARRLFAWARVVMAPMAVDETVRTWHLALLALLQREGYWDLFDVHRADAERAMPNDPRVALASAVAAEALSWTYGDARLNPQSLAPRNDLASVLMAFTELSARASVKAEALVRIGVTGLRMGDCPTARQHLAGAQATTANARLLYLSHVAGAICADRMGDASAFRYHAAAATTAIAGAQTGVTLMIVAAIREDRHGDATEALRRLYAAPTEDPWLTYRFGDGYRWPEYRSRLLASVSR